MTRCGKRSKVLALLVATIVQSTCGEWVVKLKDPLTAKAVADQHNLQNWGEVLPDSNLFHFATNGRSKRETHAALSDHPDVQWIEEQTPLKRTKRMPVDCFVSTVQTENKDSRRCVFPFIYKGKKYNSCTAEASSNGKPWCATEVRGDGQVISGKWGDCDFTSCSGEVTKQQDLPRPPPRFPSQQPPPRFLPQSQNFNSQSFTPAFNPDQQSFNPQVLPPPPPGPRSQRPTQPINRNFLDFLLRNGNLGQLPGLGPLRPGSGPPFARPPTGEEPEVDPPKLEELKTQWNDPRWPNMWFLNRGNDNVTGFGLDMNVEEAWELGASGKGVVVSILDDGVEHSHPDLKENYDPEASIDLNDKDSDPFPRYDLFNSNKHGTRCAGQVSAAANNSECSVGIAFHSKVGGVRVLDGPITDALEAKALSFNRNHIDIYSASWGPDDNGATVDGPGRLASQALKDGVEKGRNGKGSIFVWASGNGGKYADNCNADGYTTSPFTLSVSSASENGKIPWYSEPCSSSLASTYSSGSMRFRERKVTTTDLKGKCTNQHTGTSASSPIAAGIIALALEVNPELNWRDVQHLVVRTARPRGQLEANDWSENGVGLSFSHSFGFGLIDAGAMVKLAKEWETVPPQETCAASVNVGEVVIQSGSKQSVPMVMDAEHPCSKAIKFLEHLHATIDLSSRTQRGDLKVYLTSPSGTESVLLGFRPADSQQTGLGAFSQWPLMSVHYWGENPEGTWVLTVENRGKGDAVLKEFVLKFYGTTENPQPGKELLGSRKVDKEGKVLEKLRVVDQSVEDESEARGLKALEAHIALTKDTLAEAVEDIEEEVTTDVVQEPTASVNE